MTYEEGTDMVHPQGRFRLQGYYGFRFVTRHSIEAMMIKGDDGYVGVGTINPAYRLQVGNYRNSVAPNADQEADIFSSGGITINGDKFLSFDDGYKVHANMTYEEGGDVVYTEGRFRLQGYYGFRFITRNTTEAMMIKGDNGYVGIGTTSPNEKLHVAGKIRATGQEGWSDFVFYDDYDLPTLEEVESHIEEKGHLKDIPSEADVLEDGIDLTEMDAKLLQKIEELTLYLIEQNKEMKELKVRLEKAEKALVKVKYD